MRKTWFFDKQFYRTLAVLALPILVQNFLASSLNMVDTLMIGRVGENEVAAVGIANQFFFLFNLIGNGAAMGCSIFISQYWGQKDTASIKKVMGFGLTVNVVISLLFTATALLAPEFIVRLFSRSEEVVPLSKDYLVIVCLSYLFTGISYMLANALRSVGSAYLPMLVSLVAVLTNTGLPYLLIFGKGGFPVLGVRGAAIATLIARVVETLLLLILTFRPRSPFAGKAGEYLRYGKAFACKVMGAMVPVVLNEGCWALGFVLYTVAYGFIGDGTRAIAASQICNSIQNLFMVFCFSSASAALVMIGNQVGAKEEDTAKAYARRFSWLSVLMGMVIGAVVLFTAPAILSLFKVSEEARLAAVAMLRIFGIILPVRMLNVVLIVGVFRGGGDASFGLKVEAGTMWLIGVPLAFIGALLLQWPVELVVLLICAEEIVKCILSLVRLKSNRWIKHVT